MLSAAALDRAASCTSLALASAGVSPGTTSHSVPRTARRTRPVLTFNLSFLVSNVHTIIVVYSHVGRIFTLLQHQPSNATGVQLQFNVNQSPPPHARAHCVHANPVHCCPRSCHQAPTPCSRTGRIAALGPPIEVPDNSVVYPGTRTGVSAGARAEETRAVQN